jgi:hypothetical protein
MYIKLGSISRFVHSLFCCLCIVRKVCERCYSSSYALRAVSSLEGCIWNFVVSDGKFAKKHLNGQFQLSVLIRVQSTLNKHAASYFKMTKIEIRAFNEAGLGRCLVYQVTNTPNLFVCWFSWGDCNRCSVSLGDSLCRRKLVSIVSCTVNRQTQSSTTMIYSQNIQFRYNYATCLTGTPASLTFDR